MEFLKEKEKEFESKGSPNSRNVFTVLIEVYNILSNDSEKSNFMYHVKDKYESYKFAPPEAGNIWTYMVDALESCNFKGQTLERAVSIFNGP